MRDVPQSACGKGPERPLWSATALVGSGAAKASRLLDPPLELARPVLGEVGEPPLRRAHGCARTPGHHPDLRDPRRRVLDCWYSRRTAPVPAERA
jgi:hypothetical protein